MYYIYIYIYIIIYIYIYYLEKELKQFGLDTLVVYGISGHFELYLLNYKSSCIIFRAKMTRRS